MTSQNDERFKHFSSEFSQKLGLEISSKQLAEDIYNVCKWMQDNGLHFNCEQSKLERLSSSKGIELHTYWMIPESDFILLDLNQIIFYSGKPGSHEYSEFHSWGLRKNPIIKPSGKGKKSTIWQWELNWHNLFATIHPELSSEIDKRLNLSKREHNHHWLENKTTLQVAQMGAVSELMARWIWENRWAANADKSGDILSWLRSIWLEQTELMRKELEYRLSAEPQKRKNLKQTAAALTDFRKSKDFLAEGTEAIYSQEFIEMVEKSEFPIDFSIDDDLLPKQIPAKQPVSRMTTPELMNEFIRWVSNHTIDPDKFTNDFEAEDALLLKEHLHQVLQTALEDRRKTLARAKGQKPT